MTHKNYIAPMVIIGLMTVVVIGGFIILDTHNEGNIDYINKNSTTESNKDNTTASIMQSVKEIKDSKKINITTTNIKPGIKPQFKIGDKFEYKIVSNSKWFDNNNTEKLYVDRIDRINGTDYYVLFSQLKSDSGSYYFINKETGSIDKATFKLVSENGYVAEKELTNDLIFANFHMYAQWMLALKEDLNFELTITKKEITRIDEEVSDEMIKSGYEPTDRFGEVTTIEKHEFEVESVEKIKLGNKERDCFKVVRTKKEGNKITGDKFILWIDIEKRILIKEEYWFENLRIYEINLISGL